MLTNIAVAITLGNSLQDLDFALREGVSPNVDSEIFGQNGGKMLASGMYLTNNSDQLVKRGALQYIAKGSRSERALNLVIALECRHHNHPGLRELLPNGGDGADSIHIRQSEVHERDVRPVLPELLKSGLGCVCRPD